MFGLCQVVQWSATFQLFHVQ